MKYIVSDMTLHPVSDTDINDATFYFNRDMYDDNKDLIKDFANQFVNLLNEKYDVNFPNFVDNVSIDTLEHELRDLSMNNRINVSYHFCTDFERDANIDISNLIKISPQNKTLENRMHEEILNIEKGTLDESQH